MRLKLKLNAVVFVLAVLGLTVEWGAAQASRYQEHRYYPAVVAPLHQALPDTQLTPGAIDPRVTQANLDSTICRQGGYTRSVRPAESYTEALKRWQIRKYDYTNRRLRNYEEDHLVALEIGGSPTSPSNLWPEPHYTVGGWGSYTKDRLENRMHDLVCSRRVSLAQAQIAMANNWIGAYKRYVGPVPSGRSSRH